MDVTCERCGTEYEFDETLLSGRGTSVKCTNCGQVFKVFPTEATATDRATSLWRLKLKDGSIDTIDTLRELQRRIASGELTLDDEIARGEDGWKPLGAIPELDTFFQAAGVPIRSRPIASPIPPAPGPKQPSSAPPGRRPRQPTLLGVSPVQRPGNGQEWVGAVAAGGAMAAAAGTVPKTASASVAETAPLPETAPGTGSEAAAQNGPVSGSTSESASGSASGPAGASEPDVRTAWDSGGGSGSGAGWALPEIDEAEFEERPKVRGSSGARPSTPPPTYYDDDDIPDLPGRGRSPLSWLLLIVVVGALALFATQWQRVAHLLGLGSDPALIAAGVAEGDAGLAEGAPEGYASAVEAYRRAVDAGADRDPEILAKLSNAYALAAQAELDEGAPRERSENLVAEALVNAQGAMEINPRNPEVLIALSDALRLSGEHADARDLLEEARAIPFSRTPELYRVEARLSAAESNGDLSKGLRSAEEAVELAPQEVRYRLLLARAQRAAGRDADARASLATILDARPGHPVATRLMGDIEAAAAESEGADAGVAETAAEEPAAEQTAPAPEPVREPVPPADTGGAKEAVAGAARPAVSGSPKAPAAVEQKSAARAAAPVAKRRPAYDEYDQLAEAAEDDSFVDGRPPVRDYEWYMRQGRAELAAGNYSRARALFDSALEARPGSAEAMDGLGYVSTSIEDFDSALRYFRVAAQRGHPDGYFNLGRTYERLGRDEEAVSAYYTYIVRRPSGAHAAAARAAIKRLEPRAKLPAEPQPDPVTP